MNLPEGFLLVLLIFPAACLAGYPLAGLLPSLTAGVRLCLASLIGLGLWLWLVACLNLFLPVGFWAAWTILGTTWLAALLLPHARQALISDLEFIWASPGWGWSVLAPLPLIAGLLLPMMRHPDLVFFDGTSNHDSFFWITAAEWLQRHTYLTFPNPGIDPAVFRLSGAIAGVSPAWGRMGAEGLLALVASALRLSPLKVYVYAQAGLLPLWLASLVVFVRLVLAKRLPLWVFCLGASLQPIFVFFVTNNSMPNLLGALVAPVMLVAFVRLTVPAGMMAVERLGWGGVAALMLHGLLCTYPEMAPFALFAAGGAVIAKLFPTGFNNRGAALGRSDNAVAPVRSFAPSSSAAAELMKPFRTDRRVRPAPLVTGVILAGVAGLAIQPLTTWRAFQGFWNSFQIARADAIWGNFLEPLHVAAYVPALTTLNVPACEPLGPGLGWLISALLIVALIQAVRQAPDQRTALASLAGLFLLIGYTLATGFSYGWQKAVQFSGVIVAGYFTFGSFVALAPRAGIRARLLRTAAITVIAGLMAYATIWGCARSCYWAEHKALDGSFLALRNLSGGELRDRPVEVVGATFERSFFYSMWAVYALPYSRISFDDRGGQMGGYLSGYLAHSNAASPGAGKPRAYLVSRAWADSFDADAIRLSTGAHHVLVAQTNKVVAQAGLSPVTGVPRSAQAKFSITLLPYADGNFEMEISLRHPEHGPAAPLVIRYGDPAQPEAWQCTKSEFPGRVSLPAHGGVPCQVDVEATLSDKEAYPLELTRLRLTHP